MADSDDFVLDCAINALLCAFSPISSINDQDEDNHPDGPNSGDPKDLCKSRSYGTADLMQLVENLQIPFLYQNQDYHSPFTPLLVGRGGFAAIRAQTVENWLKDEDEGVNGAIKQFVVRQSGRFEDVPVDSTGTVSRLAVTQAYIAVCVMKHPHLSTHPNITQLLGITDENIAILRSDESNLCLVTEYADLGPLDGYLARYPEQLDWVVKASLICDIANGLIALHSCDIIHNDIKCSNVLLFPTPQTGVRMTAKICDFGSSVPLATTNLLQRKAATQAFAAPEAYSSSCPVRPSRDIYSLGLAILHIVTEKPPLLLRVPEEEIWEFKQGREMTKYIAECIDSTNTPRRAELKGVLVKMLEKDPEERLSDLFYLTRLLADSCQYNLISTLAYRSLESTSIAVPPFSTEWLQHHLNLSEPTTSEELLETVSQRIAWLTLDAHSDNEGPRLLQYA